MLLWWCIEIQVLHRHIILSRHIVRTSITQQFSQYYTLHKKVQRDAYIAPARGSLSSSYIYDKMQGGGRIPSYTPVAWTSFLVWKLTVWGIKHFGPQGLVMCLICAEDLPRQCTALSGQVLCTCLYKHWSIRSLWKSKCALSWIVMHYVLNRSRGPHREFHIYLVHDLPLCRPNYTNYTKLYSHAERDHLPARHDHSDNVHGLSLST